VAGDQVAGHPRITPDGSEERFFALVVQSARANGGDGPASQSRRPKLQPEQRPGETGKRAAQRRRLLELVRRELLVVFAVGQD
jgi:hypothetical protein